MCGITGYNGNRQAAPILLAGLEKLEYRGYDSAGIAVRNGDKPAEIVKAKGRLRVLAEKTDEGRAVAGTCGIGHTRWATHGEPSENNAHPHCSDDGNVVAVHNGIIENYQELRDKLSKHGYRFYSETDTEVAVKLIDYYIKKYHEGPVDAIARAMTRIRGSYAIAVMFKEYPDEIFAVRKDAPMIIGTVDGATLLASDVTALLSFTRTVYYIGNMQIARLGKGEVTFFNIDREEVSVEPTEVAWDTEAAERGGFEHFMIKEIHEQPKAVQDTINALVKDGKINLESTGIDDDLLKSIHHIEIVACGSAYHVGMAAQYIIEDMASIPVRVELASEFRYRKPVLSTEDTLVIVISQSGETADSLAALREAKELGAKTLAIVNVVGSSIAREADQVMYTWAGPEIAVASTKAYTTQLVTMFMLAMYMSGLKGTIAPERAHDLLTQLRHLPDQVGRTLEDVEPIKTFAKNYAYNNDVFYIGRSLDYYVALEGALKLKEISYIHAEAYAAGELKHGTLALIESGVPVIALATQKSVYEKTLSNIKEVKARDAVIIGIASADDTELEKYVDHVIKVPTTDELLIPLLTVVPLQLLAYYAAITRGCDVDKPRNLAKSVTVE